MDSLDLRLETQPPKLRSKLQWLQSQTSGWGPWPRWCLNLFLICYGKFLSLHWGWHLYLAEKERGPQEVSIDSKVEPAVGILLCWLAKFTSRLWIAADGALVCPSTHPVQSKEAPNAKINTYVDPKPKIKQKQERGLANSLPALAYLNTVYLALCGAISEAYFQFLRTFPEWTFPESTKKRPREK